METVELRVHGVHGTSPGSMLGVSDSEVGQVAGDSLTGIYRVKKGELPYRDLKDTGVSVEAYSWGALTSGIQGFLGWVKRALWLLLLPFAMANLAYWARLETGNKSGQARWGARAVRMSALLLTVFLILSPCVIAIDMVAWQCYRVNVPGCTRIPTQLDFLAAWTPGQRIALATVAPMLVVVILWFLSRQSLARYESTTDPADAPPQLASQPILLHPKLWDGTARTQRLQRLHIVAAIATVILFSGGHVIARANTSAVPLHGKVPWVALTVAMGGVLMVVAVVLLTVSHEDDLENLPPEGTWGQVALWRHAGYQLGELVRAIKPGLYTGLMVAAIVAYAGHVLALSWDHAWLDEGKDFYGHNLWFIGVFVLLTAMHLSVFAGGRMPALGALAVVVCVVAGAVTVAYLFHEKKEFHGRNLVVAVLLVGAFWAVLTLWHYFVSTRNHVDKAWAGAGASVMLATAAWVGLLFTSSAVIASANYLNGSHHGVGDLVTTAPGTYDPGDLTAAAKPHFAGSGDLTIEHAHVVIDGKTVKVESGTITMKGLSLVVPDDGTSSRFTEGRGPTIVVKQSDLAIAGDASLNLADSCLSEDAVTCTAEDPTFRTAGVLAGTDKVLTVEPGVQLKPTAVPEVPLVVPQVLIWTPMGQLAWLVLVVVAILWCLIRYYVKAANGIGALLFPGKNPDNLIPARDQPTCLQARKSAALAHRAETLLDVIGAVTAPVALLVIVLSMSGKPPWDLEHGAWTRHIATASMYLVVAMSAGLIMLGSQIRRSEKARKAVGVIWDLTTFWPRAAHPLAPPCYAERVVPELQTRTRWALEKDPANQVILSGHSQGSLIVVAMASRLHDEEFKRLRIVTYGSQIRGLYGRLFPRVFGANDIGYRETSERAMLKDAFPDVPRPTTPGPPADPSQDSLRVRLTNAGGAWVNLFRRSDYLGYRVFSDSDSWLDRPVPEVPREGVGDPGPVVMTHSGYQHTYTYRSYVATWTGEKPVEDPIGTEGLETLPPA
jgi:hypothetical protein